MKRLGTIIGIEVINPSFSYWKPVLVDWTVRVESFSNQINQPIYTYLERGNFSILLASASASGWAGVMEVPDYENGGQLDLLLFTSTGKYEIIEGKFDWFENLDKKATVEKVQVKLAEADKQLSNRSAFQGNRLSAVFCCPSYTRPNTVDELRTFIKGSLQTFGTCNCDALAYCFPERYLTVQGDFYRNIVCPGVVMLLRQYTHETEA